MCFVACGDEGGTKDNDPGEILPDVVAVTGVELSAESKNMVVGDEVTLTATITPEDADNKTITWASSDDAVATVAEGVVTAVAEGEATITVTTEDGGFKDECAVSVGALVVKAESIEVTWDVESVKPGTSTAIVTKILPENATTTELVWSSEDEKVAKVVNGKLVAVANGETTISVAVEGVDGVETTFDVKVYTPVASFTVDTEELILDMEDVTSGTIAYTLLPATASNKNITWTSDKEENATVAEVDGVVTVTAVAPIEADGEFVTITGTTEDGEIAKSCKVYVNAVKVKVSEINLSADATTIAIGATATISAEVLPADAFDATYTYELTSGADFATFDAETGVVTATAVGEVVITATANDGSEVAGTITITVIPVYATAIALDQTSLSVKAMDEAVTLVATFTPETATDKTITWASDNETVATVVDGVVSFLAEGTANITATATGVDPEATEAVTATCAVTVAAGPMQIGTADALVAFFSNVDGASVNADVILTADVDLTGVENTVTAFSDGAFAGVFNGGGYKITGLKINAGDASALFGQVSGEIKNLTLENVTVTGGKSVAGIVSKLLGGGKVTNCSVKNCTITGTGNDIGGIVGINDQLAIVSGCSNEGSAVSGGRAGGIVGYNNSLVIGSYNTGSVTGIADGGIIGGIVGNNNAFVTACYNTGAITAQANTTTIGGIVGAGSAKTAFAYGSYNTGVITLGPDAAATNGGIAGNYGNYPGRARDAYHWVDNNTNGNGPAGSGYVQKTGAISYAAITLEALNKVDEAVVEGLTSTLNSQALFGVSGNYGYNVYGPSVFAKDVEPLTYHYVFVPSTDGGSPTLKYVEGLE